MGNCLGTIRKTRNINKELEALMEENKEKKEVIKLLLLGTGKALYYYNASTIRIQ